MQSRPFKFRRASGQRCNERYGGNLCSICGMSSTHSLRFGVIGAIVQVGHGRVDESSDGQSPSRKSMKSAPEMGYQSRSFEMIRILARSFSDIPPHLAEFSLGVMARWVYW